MVQALARAPASAIKALSTILTAMQIVESGIARPHRLESLYFAGDRHGRAAIIQPLPGARVGYCSAGQGRGDGGGRGPDRVPSDLQHRAPHSCRSVAGIRRREGQGLRHRDPDRRHPGRDHRVLAEDPADAACASNRARGPAVRAERADRLPARGRPGPAVRQGHPAAPFHAGRRGQHLHPGRLRDPVGRETRPPGRQGARGRTTWTGSTHSRSAWCSAWP